MMSPMDRAFRRWTEAHLPDAWRGTGAPEWNALAVEASHRRFYRLRRADGAGGTVVAMSSPPALENNDQFETLAGVLEDAGVTAPRILAADRERGYFLTTDLGPVHLADRYAREADEVLPAAIDTLHRIQAIDDPAVPPYTRQRFRDELAIYTDWFLGGLLDSAPPDTLDDAFGELLAATDHQPRCCVHRDYHGRNLLLLPDGTVGVVDFQDALMGPATYDIASLLRDCYHAFPEETVARWRDAYAAASPLPLDRATFAVDMDLVALQRQLKAVGIFARLWLRDGRDSHLPHVVPVLERIAVLAGRHAPAVPALGALAAHAEVMLPAARARLEARP